MIRHSSLNIAVVLVLWLFTYPAGAFPSPKVCEAHGLTHKMNMRKAISWMIRGVELEALDGPDADWGVDENEIKHAIVEFCDRCEQEDFDKLSLRSDQFSEILNDENPRFTVVFTNQKTQASWPDLANDVKIELALSRANKGFYVQCLGKFKVAERKQPSTEPKSVLNSSFRLAGKREDLQGSRKGISSARLSVASDRVVNDTTWLVDGYAGYHHQFAHSGIRGFVTPFFYFSQKNSSARGQLVDQFGIGTDLLFEGAELGRLSLGGQFLSDGQLEKEIVSSNVTWWPSVPGGPYWNQFSPLTDDQSIWMRLDWNAIFDMNTVIRRGDAMRLVSGEEYGLAGSSLRLRLRGESGPFKNFAFDASGKYQKGIFGSIDEIYRAEAGLKYIFPNQDVFSVGIDYAYGHRPNTWEKEHLIEVQLGAKY